MKKLSLLLATLLLFSFCLFALGSGDSETANQGSGEAQSSSEANTELGKYSVIIDSCRLAKDYEGKPVVIVKYTFTNNSDENSTAFSFAFDDVVYQNGIGLNESYFVADSANYNSNDQLKEIKKGATLDVEVAYELNDTTTDINVEIKELISFNDKVITKTFSIAE